MIRKMLSMMVMLGFVAGFTACNTTKGVGEDIQKGGKAIEKSAERNGANP